MLRADQAAHALVRYLRQLIVDENWPDARACARKLATVLDALDHTPGGADGFLSVELTTEEAIARLFD